MWVDGDTLRAKFDEGKLDGELTMNETNVRPVKFAAASVAAPAGMDTATHGSSRAKWVVHLDHTMSCVMDNDRCGRPYGGRGGHGKRTGVQAHGSESF